MLAGNNDPKCTIFAIFGGKGDLTWRKLVPALFNIYLNGNLSDHFAIIIIDGVEISLNKLRQHFYEGVQQFSNEGKINKEKWNKFASHILYLNGDFLSSSTYTKLTHQCKQLETKWNFKANIIFYMATPPSLFGEIPKYLHQEGLSKDREHTRIVVEKPIGYDLQTAQELNRKLGKYFEEKQIFRIDHYLGKETVQNILAFRFANSLFEPIWNRRYIDFIAITVAEEVGVEHRGGYYDHAGAFRDMVQNHLMQLLCLIAMEPMLSFDADEIRNKKVDVLRAVRLIPQEMIQHFVVSGQYSAGRIHGKKVCGYRQEPSVSPDSLTETFVALKIFIDNWRWQGIPFYIRTGKRMPCQASEVVIQFRAVPHQAFPPEATHNWQPSRLVLSIQPQEGIVLCLQAKYPGQEMHLRNVDMKFNYQDAFEVRSPDAYETLLLDIMKNDLTLFMRADQVEIAWKLWMPIIEMWKTSPPGDFPNYEAGTWGPEASNILLAQNGHSWPLPISIKEKFIKQLF